MSVGTVSIQPTLDGRRMVSKPAATLSGRETVGQTVGVHLGPVSALATYFHKRSTLRLIAEARSTRRQRATIPSAQETGLRTDRISFHSFLSPSYVMAMQTLLLNLTQLALSTRGKFLLLPKTAILCSGQPQALSGTSAPSRARTVTATARSPIHQNHGVHQAAITRDVLLGI